MSRNLRSAFLRFFLTRVFTCCPPLAVTRFRCEMEQHSSACVDPGSYAISIFGRHDKDGDGSLNRTAPQCQLQLLWPAAMPAARDGPGRTFSPWSAA